MKLKIALCFLIGFCIPVIATVGKHVDYEEDLVDALTKTYRKGGRPVKSNKEPVVVYYDLKISKLEKLVTLNQVLIVHTFVMMTWADHDLAWNVTEYNGTDIITLDESSVWTPDIMLYNTADDTNKSPRDMYKAPVTAFPNGSVIWYVPVVWKSSCKVDITWFPVDKQVCSLVFASQAYTKTRLELRFHKRPLTTEESQGHHHVTNGEWDVLGMEGEASHAHYDWSKEEVSQIIYTLSIKRRPLFFVLYMIIPVCAIVFLSLLTFIIPPDTGERVGFGVTILLTMGVYLMVISEDLPKTANTAPLIGVLYITLFYVMALAYVASTINVSLIEKVTKPPKFLMRLIRNKASRQTTNFRMSRRRTLSGVQDRVGELELKKNWQNIKCEAIDEGNNVGPVRKVSSSTLINHVPRDYDGELEKKNNESWRKIVKVLDKFFFWGFFLAILFASAVVIGSLELSL